MRRDIYPEGYTAPLIKICGLTDIRESAYLNEAKADYAGFVFYPPSKRFVSVDQARGIAEGLNETIKRVAVLVSPEPAEIERIQQAGFIDIIQIHKELSSEVLDVSDLPVWRALNLASGSDETDHLIGSALSHIPKEHRHKIDAVLVDAPDFGSGQTFEWGNGRSLKTDVKFILAGGLNAGNVAEGIKLFRPDIVDVSSGVEGDHGKDKGRIMEFVNAVRNTAAEYCM